jgi:hypothetical protein
MAPDSEAVMAAVEELIRSYRMNWASLKIIHRQDRSLGVGTDTTQAARGSAGFLFNAHTNAPLGAFASLRDAEVLIRREAAHVYGAVRSAEEAAARFEGLLKEVSKD